MSSEDKRGTVTSIGRGHEIRAERAHAADMADHAMLSPKAWDVVNKIGNIVKHNKKTVAVVVAGALASAAAGVITVNVLSSNESREPYGSAPSAQVTFGSEKIDIEKGKGGNSLNALIRKHADSAERAAEAAHPGVDIPSITERTIHNMRSDMQTLNPDSVSFNGVYSVGAGKMAILPEMTVTPGGLYEFAFTPEQMEKMKGK